MCAIFLHSLIWRRALIVAIPKPEKPLRDNPQRHIGKIAAYGQHLTSQNADITCRTLEAACWLWLGCWKNNVANSHLSPWSTQQQSTGLLSGSAVLTPASLYLSSTTPCELWLDACVLQFTSGQHSHSCRHPSLWTSLQWSHTDSNMPCRGAWTPAPLHSHPFNRWECTASQIETSICARRTTTH